jgi:hypothetical protein
MRNYFKTLLVVLAASFQLWPFLSAGQPQASVTFFHGSKVTIAMPAIGQDEEKLPLGPAIVCVAFPPAPQCYTPPKENPPFGADPKVRVVQLKPGRDALLFQVRATAGGSGSKNLLALLEPGKGKRLSNLLTDVTFGNQSEYRFLNVATISDMPLLAIADASWGAGETHFSKHRFTVTIYSYDAKLNYYGLRDQYLTSGKYPSFDEVDVINVLEPEREEILARLRRQH